MRVFDLERVKPGLVTLGWATSIAGLALAGIFHGQLLPNWFKNFNPQPGGLSSPSVFYLEVFAVSVLAGMVLNSMERALLGFFVSFGLACLITYLVLALPGYLGSYPLAEVLFGLAIVFTFSALFPFPLVAGLAGAVLGTGLAERFF